jgi:hypothetical protein
MCYLVACLLMLMSPYSDYEVKTDPKIEKNCCDYFEENWVRAGAYYSARFLHGKYQGEVPVKKEAKAEKILLWPQIQGITAGWKDSNSEGRFKIPHKGTFGPENPINRAQDHLKEPEGPILLRRGYIMPLSDEKAFVSHLSCITLVVGSLEKSGITTTHFGKMFASHNGWIIDLDPKWKSERSNLDRMRYNKPLVALVAGGVWILPLPYPAQVEGLHTLDMTETGRYGSGNTYPPVNRSKIDAPVVPPQAEVPIAPVIKVDLSKELEELKSENHLLYSVAGALAIYGIFITVLSFLRGRR